MRNTVDPEKSSPLPRPPVKKITAAYLENSGKFYLERFPASTAQFRRVMTRKIDRSCRSHADQDREECLNLLETLISRFQTIGFLDDPAYASGLRYSLTQRGYSSSRIAQTLRQKGISPDWLQEASAREPLDPDHDWLAALRWIKKNAWEPIRRGMKDRIALSLLWQELDLSSIWREKLSPSRLRKRKSICSLILGLNPLFREDQGNRRAKAFLGKDFNLPPMQCHERSDKTEAKANSRS
jgi:SOS response regulatory protein OraA/RecX